jgi:hypothetical protein
MHEILDTGHLPGRLDGRIVKWTTAEPVDRCTSEDGQQSTTGCSILYVESSFVRHSTAVMNAAEVLLDELSLAGKVLVKRTFGHVGLLG